MCKNDYAESEFMPHGLNKEEIENPYIFFDELFDLGNLPEIRKMLRELLEIAVCGNFHKQTHFDRANMIYFYNKLVRLIEVVHVIYDKRREKMKAEVSV